MTRTAPPRLDLRPDPLPSGRRPVLAAQAARQGRAWPAALASLALHGAVLGGILLLLPEALKPPEGEHGVEMVWQDVAEDELPFADSAGAPLAPPSVEAPATPEAAPSPEVPPPPQPAPVAAPVPALPPPPAQRLAPPPPQVARVEPPPVLAPRVAPPPPLAPPAVPPPAPRIAEAPPAPPETTAELAAAPESPTEPLPPPPEPSPAPPPAPQVAEAEPPPEATTEQAEALPPPPPPMPLPAPMPPIRTAELRAPAPRPAAQPMRPMPGMVPLGRSEDGPRETALVGGSRAIGAVVPPGLLDGVRNAQPEYPSASRLRGEQGVVALVLQISAGGHVTGVEIGRSSGFPQLDEAARKAAQRWRFRPASRDGVPVEGSIRTQVHFRLVQ